jgi:glucose-1-phosphate adenylyltransferase
MQSVTSLIILAGGASSRMKKDATILEGLSQEDIKQANERSKGLIGVGEQGRPLLDYVLFNAKQAGFIKVYFVIGENDELFKSLYGFRPRGNLFEGLEISYAIQTIPDYREKPFGTADALFQTVEQYPELNEQRYSVCNSDNLYSVAALQSLRKTKYPNAFIAYDRDALEFNSERIARFALVKMNERGILLDIIEKPEINKTFQYKDEAGKLRVSMNAFTFEGSMLFPFLQDCPVHPEREEKELPTALLNMLKKYPESTIGIPFSEHVPDLTAKDDIVAVKKYLEANFEILDWKTV